MSHSGCGTDGPPLVFYLSEEVLIVMLCLVTLFSSMMIAQATSNDSNDPGALIPYSQADCGITIEAAPGAIEFDATASETLENTQDDIDSNVDIETYSSTESVAVRQIVAYPLILCIEDQTLSHFGNIYAVANWSIISQSEALFLSTAQKNALYARVDNGIANLNDGKTYRHAGWRVYSTVELKASRPRYIRWTPSSTCLTSLGERKYDVNFTSTRITIDELFGIPVKNSPTDYYYVGVSGGFHYYHANGNLGNFLVGAGLGVN